MLHDLSAEYVAARAHRRPLAAPTRRRCPFAKASATGSCPICAADFAGDCLNPSCTATPVLDFAGGATAGGALVKYADGRESLAFIFDCAAFSPTCMVLGHLSLSWLLHDIIPGQRDVLLTVHQ
jgi:hypothetical protein